MVNVGIIGLGPAWEVRYRPALERIAERIGVRSVYDPVAARAEQVAAELGARPFLGIKALLQSGTAEAALILDPSWYGWHVLQFALDAGRPAYVAGSLGEDVEALGRLHEAAGEGGLTLMPEFGRRYTPATGRLQELIATCLGRPRRIVIEAETPRSDAPPDVPGRGAGTDFLVGLLDWCRYLMRSDVGTIVCRPLAVSRVGTARHPPDEAILVGDAHPSSSPGQLISFDFQSGEMSHGGCTAELHIREPNAGPADSKESPTDHVRQEIECEHGAAVIASPASIEWTAGSDRGRERLAADRDEVEVMLDHFCRRIVGGLVPVADLADVCAALRLVRAANESLTTGQPVELT